MDRFRINKGFLSEADITAEVMDRLSG